MALNLKVNGREFMLRKVMTGTLLTSQRFSESQTKQSYLFARAHNDRMKTNETVLASTFSSPPMGRDENVPKSFLLTEFNNDFDTYQKKSLTDVVALANCI